MVNDLYSTTARRYAAGFKRGILDFIVNQNGRRHERQLQALNILLDHETKEFGYGGAAGGAKSWTGCVWLAYMAALYPGTTYFIGRQELKRIRQSTLQTFYKVCKAYDITGWKLHGQDNCLNFSNGSRIDLLDLRFLPSDDMYERYGSIEYTSGWIEEGGEVHFGAYDTLKSRVGRQLNKEHNIKGKIFVTLNPKKNWCHSTFWKPYKNNTLPPNTKFLQALVTDNPFIDPDYIDNLHNIKDKVRKQRLLFGNFDYDDSDDALMDYDAITDIFTNDFVEPGDGYITADIARFGSDKTVVGRWSGMRCEEILEFEHKRKTETAEIIKQLRLKHSIPISNIVVDDDGVGGGVVDILGCNGFVNNSSPLPNPEDQEKENYANLKSQCGYLLADAVNKWEIHVNCEDMDMREGIIEEMEQIKQKDPDGDGKLAIVPKEIVKQMIGRSPDRSDMLLMRMWFKLSPKRNFIVR